MGLSDKFTAALFTVWGQTFSFSVNQDLLQGHHLACASVSCLVCNQCNKLERQPIGSVQPCYSYEVSQCCRAVDSMGRTNDPIRSFADAFDLFIISHCIQHWQ